jgi:ABC-type multidrug transport system fused ATPase/permease subunit
MFLQVCLSVLDLIGVALMGILVSLTSKKEGAENNSATILEILKLFGLHQLSYRNLILTIGLLLCFTIIGKSIFMLILVHKLNTFLSVKSSEVYALLLQRLLSTSLLRLQSKSTQTFVSILNYGPPKLFFDVVLRAILTFGDLIMILIMLTFLFAFNPLIAFSATIIFGSVAALLVRLTRKRVGIENRLQWQLELKSNEELFQILTSFRENFVKNRLYFFSKQLTQTRISLSKKAAYLNFLPYVSKYTFETAVTASAILIIIIEFNFGSSQDIFLTLGVFLGAATRIAPAALRMQQNFVELNGALGATEPIIQLIDELRSEHSLAPSSDEFELAYSGFEPNISLRNISFSYPGSNQKVLKNITLNLSSKQIYAIVGESGSGKSTLIDVILGILQPENGSVTISGVSPLEAIQKWPGAIGYVPQDVVIINGTISENITFGFPPNINNNDLIEEVAKLAKLKLIIEESNLGLQAQVGDRGSKLSGGQRQRLGIARAMYTKPKLLILDEATSSLDGQTEEEVSDAIFKDKSLTVLTIAHRLSTIKKADKVIYIANGIIECVGTLEEVRNLVTNFDAQMKLMGMQ